MKLKVCGMKYHDNIEQVATLPPDYLGFIFYKKSARFFNGQIPQLPEHMKKVGVFVNASIEEILELIKTHQLDAIQLHGEESAAFCKQLKSIRSRGIEIIKVFSIKEAFNFELLEPFENVCDYYLFDTKGKLPGGNGYTFNWNVLNEYPSSKPFFLSGGIGLEQAKDLKEFQKNKVSKYCYAIDVNSRFEIEAGLKNIEDLKRFKKEL